MKGEEYILEKRNVYKLAEPISEKLKVGTSLCLLGDLGAGKTFFASEVIRILTKNPNLNITSPTYNIVNKYIGFNEIAIYHFDLYRLKSEQELENIGFFDFIEEGICIIEWPEIAKKFLQNPFFVSIIFKDETKRKFILL